MPIRPPDESLHKCELQPEQLLSFWFPMHSRDFYIPWWYGDWNRKGQIHLQIQIDIESQFGVVVPLDLISLYCIHNIQIYDSDWW